METVCGATFSFDHDGPPDMIENDLTGGAYRVTVGRGRCTTGSQGPTLTSDVVREADLALASGFREFVRMLGPAPN